LWVDLNTTCSSFTLWTTRTLSGAVCRRLTSGIPYRRRCRAVGGLLLSCLRYSISAAWDSGRSRNDALDDLRTIWRWCDTTSPCVSQTGPENSEKYSSYSLTYDGHRISFLDSSPSSSGPWMSMTGSGVGGGGVERMEGTGTATSSALRLPLVCFKTAADLDFFVNSSVGSGGNSLSNL
jgi:hypothetical protein